jgi:nucleoside-diphosphate-sugar epimerase
MRVILVGANGFVGSAFRRVLIIQGHEVLAVDRSSYGRHVGAEAELVIDVAGNSRKFFAEEQPVREFDTSVAHALRVVHDFKSPRYLHVSSVDVYADLTSPATTHEAQEIDLGRTSHYGFHKLLAEQIVRHYRKDWLIVRLAGMVGPGLKKNPVFDILQGQPLRIHPDSRYQFMLTDRVAEIALGLLKAGLGREIVNVCGDGLVSPREIGRLAGRELDLSLLPAGTGPRIVDVSTAKLAGLVPVPRSLEAVEAFVRQGLS